MTIQWKLNVPTVYYWLGSYLELLRDDICLVEREDLRNACLELVDLAIHLPLSLMFSYSLIAASALYIRLQNGTIQGKSYFLTFRSAGMEMYGIFL
jgi:hypothetical protein